MIVTCPSCNSRYKIDAAKIKGRGAKITCPNCSHKFVVYKEGESVVDPSSTSGVRKSIIPSDIGRRSFPDVGIVWTIRKGVGVTYEFSNLNQLRDYLDEGTVTPQDVLSYNAKDWVPINEIGDLEAYFHDIWKKAEAGEIKLATSEDTKEDESDAPTTLVGHGSALADEIRRAVQEATTPAPAADRGTKPRTDTPAPPPLPVREPERYEPPDTTGVLPVVSATKGVQRRPTPKAESGADPFAKLAQPEGPSPAMGIGVIVMVMVAVPLLGGIALWFFGFLGGTR